jgi:hypothetical protein
LILSIDSEIEDTSEVKAPEEKNKPHKRKRLSPHLKMKKVMKNMMLLF